MGDEPNTSGFLCHICMWRERAESHELMDIEALIRHGGRYHYLQQSQMVDYRKLSLRVYISTVQISEPFNSTVRAAYQVHRSPLLHHGYSHEQFPQVPDTSFTPPERLTPGAWHSGAMDFVPLLPIKMEDSEEETSLVGSFSYLVGRSSRLNIPEGHGLQELDQGCYGEHPILRPMNLNDQGSEDFNGTPIFNSPKYRQDELYLPEIFNDLDLDPNGMYGDWTHTMTLPNVCLDPNGFGGEPLMETINLARFDHELAGSPIFDAQLLEYKDQRGWTTGGYLGLPGVIGITPGAWEEAERRDRLHVWPEKVTSASGTFGGCVKGHEEDDGSVRVFAGDFGDAGEYMDLREME